MNAQPDMKPPADAPVDLGEVPRHARLLVIKLGALGDFVQSLGPMRAIREHHLGAHITLLTTAPFESLARDSGYFDEVWLDRRPAWWQPGTWVSLTKRLRNGGFDRVYDLQTASRTGRYWRLMGRPEWSGNVPGCSHPDSNPDRNRLHTIERQQGQLRDAGIPHVPLTDLSWVDADIDGFGIGHPYILLVPGGSAHRPGKRWPAEKYASLARRLVRLNYTPVVIGGAAEKGILGRAGGTNLGIRSLIGRTSFQEIVQLARFAAGAVGNDTGPMHLIAMAGCPSVVLFSEESDPALCAPRPGSLGGKVTVIQRPELRGLSVEQVEAALSLESASRKPV